ncbi:hypothetical protein [Streptomyces sp. Ncost-T10-10d]|uniref:hypothetical protein n=1 Tax=Streptomyces sp. Ncost-T10-10d TaxID=1839774 RepID=UPI00159F2A1A|nr:hypothetical protein [Streptomyces sp. Ncost-T10-10d]
MSDSVRLRLARRVGAPLTCLNEARYGIVRGVTGSARSMPQARTRGLPAIGA